ncbi:hypothetical protein D3C71_1769240 [compost metagenome]
MELTALMRSFTPGFCESTTTVKPAFLSRDRSDSLAFLLLVFWPLASGYTETLWPEKRTLIFSIISGVSRTEWNSSSASGRPSRTTYTTAAIFMTLKSMPMCTASPGLMRSLVRHSARSKV